MYKKNHISVIIPAHNEALAIGGVVSDLKSLGTSIDEYIVDAIIVCDNASTDTTAKRALANGAQVVYESTPGYGSACQGALAALTQTDIVVFVDGDGSMNIGELPLLLDAIVSDADLAIGVRVAELQEAGALLWQQRVGTQLACRLMSLLYRKKVSDLGPFRAIKYSALKALEMSDQRFGWTAEMQVKALEQNLRTQEVPVSTLRRAGKSKISGTIRGTVLACHDIFHTILTLWWASRPSCRKQFKHYFKSEEIGKDKTFSKLDTLSKTAMIDASIDA